jgi:hypothetical protein
MQALVGPELVAEPFRGVAKLDPEFGQIVAAQVAPFDALEGRATAQCATPRWRRRRVG